MRRLPVLLLVLLPVAALSEGPEEEFRREVLPVIRATCLRCHSGDDAESGIDLEAADLADRAT
jgi:hypothetical protein